MGDIVSVPISHGEGRFLCPPDLLAQLAENGQIATQYVDLDGHPTMDIDGNPNGSVWSVRASPHPTAGSSADGARRAGGALPVPKYPGELRSWPVRCRRTIFSLTVDRPAGTGYHI
ncbi:MAG: phosphoribosylformylglycinamidine synthase subunit PurQ [Dysosmobacter welbionis]